MNFLIKGLLLAATVSAASATPISFIGVNGVNDGTFYVTPYQLSINHAAAINVTCYDILDGVDFGDTWDANILNLAQAASTGYFGGQPNSTAGYERIAFLDSQDDSTPDLQIALQHAIWSVFAPNTHLPALTDAQTADEVNYNNAADLAARSYTIDSFDNARFIEQVGGVSGTPPTEQAFVYFQGTEPFSPLFSQALGLAAPEPGSFGLGIFAALAFFGLFRYARRLRRSPLI